MTITVFFWEQSPAYPAGHCAIEINHHYADFRVWMNNDQDSKAAMPSVLIDDKNFAFFENTVKRLALNDLRTRDKLRVPAGTCVYAALYKKFVLETTPIEDFCNWSELFNPLQESAVANGSKQFLEGALALGLWLQRYITTNQGTYEHLIQQGHPDHCVDLDFLRDDQALELLNRLRQFQQENRLCWYAKSGGSNGDQATDTIRHNCASIIFSLLDAAGMTDHLSGFQEHTLIAPTLQKSIQLNAEADGKTPDSSALGKASWLGITSRGLWAIGQGDYAISKRFGTMPRVVYEMALYAQARPVATLSQSWCSIS